jgi:hypothetical protein
MRKGLFLLVLLSGLALPACGAADGPERSDATAQRNERPGDGVALKRVGEFDEPVYVTGAPGFPELLFVVEQPGRVIVLSGGRKRGAFLDLRSQVGYGGEQGLLSLAFPPDYRQSRRLYVYYTDNAGNIRVDEFKRRSATRAGTSSQRRVIEIPHPVNSNHNGGQLQFLGNLLYFGTGDGGAGGDPPNNAQNKGVLLGKLLRIDPRPAGGRPYSAPPSNPFAGRPGRDEIYSYGLRNPFRFSFDTVTAQRPRIAIGERVRGDRLHDGRRRRRRQLRLGRLRGPLPLRRRKRRHPGPGRHGQADPRLPAQPRRQLLGDRRLRRPRQAPALAVQALRIRRLLRGRAAQPRATPRAGGRRPPARPLRAEPQLVRRGHPRPPLRDLARRARIPLRQTLKRQISRPYTKVS